LLRIQTVKLLPLTCSLGFTLLLWVEVIVLQHSKVNFLR